MSDAVLSGRKAIQARAAFCAARYGGKWFAEVFVEGREFNVAVLEEDGAPRVLPMAEMRFEEWPQNKPRLSATLRNGTRTRSMPCRRCAISDGMHASRNWRHDCAIYRSGPGVCSDCEDMRGWIFGST